MYQRIGTLPDPRRWADEAIRRLGPFTPSVEGYATTDRERTRAALEPLLVPWFPGRWTGASLVIVLANGSIPPHEDGDDGGRLSRRLVVLQSNPRAWCWHDGDWQQLVEGRIYDGDFTRTHAAINWGGEPRIHLVVDTVRE
jgi:hypothetical protein